MTRLKTLHGETVPSLPVKVNAWEIVAADTLMFLSPFVPRLGASWRGEGDGL